MTAATIFFMALTLLGAVVSVNVRNVMHAVLSLAVALAGIGGLFLVLGSPFVGAMQVLIYVGGISVMMIFAVMLSSSISAGATERSLAYRALALVPCLAFLGCVAMAVSNTAFGPIPVRPEGTWEMAPIGRALLTEYALNFELLSLVLLLAIVGSVTIARQGRPDGPEETNNEESS